MNRTRKRTSFIPPLVLPAHAPENIKIKIYTVKKDPHVVYSAKPKPVVVKIAKTSKEACLKANSKLPSLFPVKNTIRLTMAIRIKTKKK